MRETIRIRHMQIMGINAQNWPMEIKSTQDSHNNMGNNPRKLSQKPWRIGDFVSLMISANFKKKVHNSYIKFEYNDIVHKSLKRNPARRQVGAQLPPTVKHPQKTCFQ